MARPEQAIDEILETLFAIDVQGYTLGEQTVKSEAIKRIHRTIDKLAKSKQQAVKDEASYRLEQFEKFSKMKKAARQEIIQIARERHISIEEAYRIAASQ